VLQAIARARTRRAVKFLLHQLATLPAFLKQVAELAARDVAGAHRALQELLVRGERCRLLVEGATVAIIGPPNAGKSTLANRLFGLERSIVSDVPGTTRDWVSEPTAIQGVPVTVVDTAGVGQPADDLEKLAVERGMARWTDADLQLLVLDGSDNLPDTFFERVMGRMRARGWILVVSKCDLPRRWRIEELPPGLQVPPVVVSARRGDGIAMLEERITAQLAPSPEEEQLPGLFTRRQRDSVLAILGAENLKGEELARRLRREILLGRQRTCSPGDRDG
jgi:tRNA modification GTPase